MPIITRAKDQPPRLQPEPQPQPEPEPQPQSEPSILPEPPILEPPKCINCLCDHGGHEDAINENCTHHPGLFNNYKKCQEFLNS